MEPDFEVIVVGAGPAGASVALHLARLAPTLARRTLLLERATLPRPKPCAGGVTGKGLAVLGGLGLTLGVPALPIHRVEVSLGAQRWAVEAEGLAVTVARGAFDHWLAREAVAAGATLHDGEVVTGVVVGEAGVRVATARGTYTARCLVAADGGSSTVRKLLAWPPSTHRARLLYVETDGPPEDVATLSLDFTPMAAGLHGYLWDFPSPLPTGVGCHRGLYDRGDEGSRRGNLKPLFRDALAARGVDLDACVLGGFHERELARGVAVARPRLLLAGEAAGIDPLFGEGIAQALAHGGLVAAEVARVATSGDWSFRGAAGRFARSRLGLELAGGRWLANALYQPRGPARLARLFAAPGIASLAARHLAGRLHPAVLAMVAPPLLALGALGLGWRGHPA
ncbi:MAG: hypothetical protein COW73_09245 [Nitrospirae bacterium CG18_big_fil_WC_8_21_14_2_50_70_55]|nr:NAD(P)/FAD-dependent oxidoreductase [Deltaproteobacteria bacterium]OIP63959.1 MAG: hypothetical protein AUK30_07445 [Nitrospirae bacterium CG2_30_70_394]PIQ04088.1 MAG: hypothetical protein COW73_09245 [Nitrospirae bacterium CG18_big_fil_WC_8_21_14_2_50_70_55]PIU77711.1 MAG: hypothetical protein COS73_09150 [Nitrospirae bacterium CG06_land_8_20_14_3_00_70_43]PIW82557.1 MAG: hypothetical protein COZ96_08060 [Nitrospirae bacterium CG_4_8_14_3_um_filter_70_85]PIX83793.1 MAG: hypothetical prote